MKNIFAVDIGGSKTECAVIKENGEIIEVYRKEYESGYTINTVTDAIKEGFNKLKHLPMDVCGTAIPGLCDPQNGTWIYSPFSGIESVQITSIIKNITGLDVWADNDVNVCALAEQKFGTCKEINDFLWITVSNGIGGAIVLNGNLYRGANYSSGEIGHVTVEENTDRICGCGKKGCLEIMASGASIADIYSKKTGTYVRGASDVAKRAKKGDITALSVFEQSGTYIGKALASAANILGIDVIIIGGGVAQEFDLFKESALESLNKHVFLRASPNIKVLPSGLKRNAALLGCVALVLNKENI